MKKVSYAVRRWGFAVLSWQWSHDVANFAVLMEQASALRGVFDVHDL